MKNHFFLARQPILDRNLKLYAYELLFRSSSENCAPAGLDDDAATAQVLTNAMEIGIDRLSRGHITFINLPRQFLLDPDLLPIEPVRVMLEILEDVVPDDDVLAGVESLRETGFKIALDDVVESESYDRLMPMVDTVKIDIRAMPEDTWAAQIGRIKTYGCKVLAEKVETEEEFQTLKALGVDYFQGYFFARPRIVSGRRLPTNKIALLRLLARISDPDTDLEELQSLISQDVGLSVRALAYVNSAANALNRKIDSIKEAIVYLGRGVIRNWVVLYIMSGVDGKADEIVTMGLVRGRLCELLAEHCGLANADSYFTVGLLSVLDALLDVPLEEALKYLPLPEDMQDALINREGDRGEALSCALSLEAGDAGSVEFRNLDAMELADIYMSAVQWADVAARQAGLE
ncbi:EAL and HDOD domain-containing protein [Haliea salexigens]|uniref:EAL and HDOD domain-containing protein n=1 Tax=Haliea salexigens TaxID=287487 RepID=UPI00041EDBF3|nr:EAL domain-containing protein [Haliea salexigens]